MKSFALFTAVVVISYLFQETKTEMVKRGFHNVIEVTDDHSKKIADAYLTVTYPLVQFFAFNSNIWSNGAAEMSKASHGLDSYYFLSYNCNDEPQYCPSDVTKTSYRFYKYRELKKTVEDDELSILPAWKIQKVFEDL